MDPIMASVVGAIFLLLSAGLILRYLRQPYVVAYLLAGILIGPQGLGLINDQLLISRIGAFGIILLLFFIGMEISPRQLTQNWKVAVFGTLLQILLSVACVWGVGAWLDWEISRIVMLGFVISLSSTAVVLKLLKDWGELDTPCGQDVISILLVQDIAVVPMMLILDYIGGGHQQTGHVLLQLVAGAAVVLLLIWLAMRESVQMPWLRWLKGDREMQLFGALAICFGVAWLTGLLGLSTALGAFVAGAVIGVARETHWVHESLDGFRMLFMAVFFVSVGMMLDLDFLLENLHVILLLVLLVLLLNTLLNAAILRVLGDPWRENLYSGAMLAQVGEFSFLIAAVGWQSGTISEYGYQLVIAMISLSLFVSPAWIQLARRLLSIDSRRDSPGPHGEMN
jgi:CPA2 family monovalent cation:H+ antiporter-2